MIHGQPGKPKRTSRYYASNDWTEGCIAVSNAAMIDIWQRHAGNQPRMLQAEAESLARLITGATARNLIRVFFLMERLKSQSKVSSRRSLRHVISRHPSFWRM